MSASTSSPRPRAWLSVLLVVLLAAGLIVVAVGAGSDWSGFTGGLGVGLGLGVAVASAYMLGRLHALRDRGTGGGWLPSRDASR